MKKKKAYITPEVRIILVETQGVMADFVSPGGESKVDPNHPVTLPTDGSGDESDLGKFNSGSLWDFDEE